MIQIETLLRIVLKTLLENFKKTLRILRYTSDEAYMKALAQSCKTFASTKNDGKENASVNVFVTKFNRTKQILDKKLVAELKSNDPNKFIL